MITLKWERLALVVVVGMVAQGTNIPVSSGQEKSSPDKGRETKKTDVHGDPLPEGARARMGTLRWRHPAKITFVGFTARNKQLVTGCGDGYFRVWNTDNGKEIRKFGKLVNNDGGRRSGVAHFVTTYGSGSIVALSADGKVLAQTGGDGLVRLWDVANGKEIRILGNDPKKEKGDKGPIVLRLGFPMAVSNLAFSPDGKALATREFGDRIIRLWDTGTGKEIRQMVEPDQPKPGGKGPFIANGGAGNTLAFLADGKSLVSAGMEVENQRPSAILRIYNAESGKESRQIKAGQKNFFMASGVAILPKSKTIAWGGTDGTVGLFDAESGKEIRRVGKPQQNVFIHTVLVSPDGKIMATQTNSSRAIHLWDVASGKELRKMGEWVQGNWIFNPDLHKGLGSSTTIAISPDGKTLAEGTAGKTVRLWKVDTGKEIVPVSSGHHGAVNRLAVSPDGKVLTTFAGDRDQTIRQWETATGKEMRQIQLPVEAYNVALTDKLAAWIAAEKISLWDVALGKEIRVIDEPNQQQGQLYFPFGMGNGRLSLSANGKLLAVRGSDQVIRLYDTATGKQYRRLAEPVNAAPNTGGVFVTMGFAFGRPAIFSPNGDAIASISSTAGPQMLLNNPGQFGEGGGTLRLWNLSHGKNPRLFETKQAILDLAVTPDGRNIVTANSEYTISLWEALTGKECLNIKVNFPKATPPALQPPGMMPQTNSITAMAISPDGRTLAAALERIIFLGTCGRGKNSASSRVTRVPWCPWPLLPIMAPSSPAAPTPPPWFGTPLDSSRKR